MSYIKGLRIVVLYAGIGASDFTQTSGAVICRRDMTEGDDPDPVVVDSGFVRRYLDSQAKVLGDFAEVPCCACYALQPFG